VSDQPIAEAPDRELGLMMLLSEIRVTVRGDDSEWTKERNQTFSFKRLRCWLEIVSKSRLFAQFSFGSLGDRSGQNLGRRRRHRSRVS
jgi:hypothetical protein